MKYLFPLLLIVSVNAAMNQSKKLDSKSDTSFWFQLKQLDAHRIGLTNLTTSSDSVHFRFWMENQAIDIWTNDYMTFYGNISNHTESIQNDQRNSGDSRKASKYFSNITNLSPIQAKTVFDLFDQCQIFRFPTDSRIKGWAQGNDGEELLFEFSTRHTYSFTTYWTPSAQTNVPEADVINNLVLKLRSLLMLNVNWKSFLSGLPIGCYRSGEMTMECNTTKTRFEKAN